ncbi:MAG: hypothetical protein HGB34_02460 [Candidatus Moranbacteria bacterium]|nr:hypothetical protein [Candidatus Moranbacteria bacterium]
MRLEIKGISDLSAQNVFIVVSRRSRWFFLLLFLIAIGSGLQVWYRNVYHGDWTDEEKQRYVDTTFRETDFRAEEFRHAIDAISRRNESYGADMRVEKNLFLPVPVTESGG